MEISIVGYSSLVQRKILNSLNKIKEIKYVNIFSRRKINLKEFENLNFEIKVYEFASLEKISSSCNSLFYYISTENEIHDELTYLLLSNFKNVVVDKPISISKRKLLENINLAQKNKCFLSEVLTWEFHSQIDYLKNYIKQNNDLDINIRFTIPLPSKSNFRVNKSKGSGVFWDMISYFVSTLNLFNIEDKFKISNNGNFGEFCNQWMEINIDNQLYKVNALFGFGFPYQNKLEIISKSEYFIFNRIYTSDASEPVIINKVSNVESIELKFIDDSFMNYFKNVIHLIKSGNLENELINIKKRYAKFLI